MIQKNFLNKYSLEKKNKLTILNFKKLPKIQAEQKIGSMKLSQTP